MMEGAGAAGVVFFSRSPTVSSCRVQVSVVAVCPVGPIGPGASPSRRVSECQQILHLIRETPGAVQARVLRSAPSSRGFHFCPDGLESHLDMEQAALWERGKNPWR